MILRRYGTTFQSVAPDFNSKALTEIGFRRDRQLRIPVEEFQEGYERIDGHDFAASADGPVHDEAEQAALAEVEAGLRRLVEELGEGELLVVESEQGVDYPKTRSVQRNVVVKGENRLHFTVRIDPPLRIGVYRKRG